jgi:subtilisin family serine protease
MIARTPPSPNLNAPGLRRFDATERARYCLEHFQNGVTESASPYGQKVKYETIDQKPKDFDFCAMQPGKGILFERLGLKLYRPDREIEEASEAHENAPILRRPVRLKLIPHLGVAQDSVVNETVTGPWALEETGVLDSSFKGNGIKVCVIDTGIDLFHPDLAHVDSDHRRSFVGDLMVHDTRGHGTRCAGIIAGPENPASGPRYSVAPGVELFVARVFGGIEPCIVRLIAALEWAVSNECDIVSMSLGNDASGAGQPISQELEMAANAALLRGTLVVAGAGNNSNRADGLVSPVNHPASCPSIIAVGAVEHDLSVANYSTGAPNSGDPKVDIAAPGTARSATKGGGYETRSGTSIATPFVAGIAALYAEACPKARGKDLWDLLTKKARPLGKPVGDVGAGLIFAPRREDSKLCELVAPT